MSNTFKRYRHNKWDLDNGGAQGIGQNMDTVNAVAILSDSEVGSVFVQGDDGYTWKLSRDAPLIVPIEPPINLIGYRKDFSLSGVSDGISASFPVVTGMLHVGFWTCIPPFLPTKRADFRRYFSGTMPTGAFMDECVNERSRFALTVKAVGAEADIDIQGELAFENNESSFTDRSERITLESNIVISAGDIIHREFAGTRFDAVRLVKNSGDSAQANIFAWDE